MLAVMMNTCTAWQVKRSRWIISIGWLFLCSCIIFSTHMVCVCVWCMCQFVRQCKAIRSALNQPWSVHWIQIGWKVNEPNTLIGDEVIEGALHAPMTPSLLHEMNTKTRKIVKMCNIVSCNANDEFPFIVMPHHIHNGCWKYRSKWFTMETGPKWCFGKAIRRA